MKIKNNLRDKILFLDLPNVYVSRFCNDIGGKVWRGWVLVYKTEKEMKIYFYPTAIKYLTYDWDQFNRLPIIML